MDPGFLMILTFLLTVIFALVYAIKIVVDSRVHHKLIASNPSDALVNALLGDEKRQRRNAALRCGLVLSFLAAGLVLIQVIGWNDAVPGAIGILLGATGLGNLVFFAYDRASVGRERDNHAAR